MRRRLGGLSAAAVVAASACATLPISDWTAGTRADWLPPAVRGLPLVAVESAPETDADRFVVWMSGDGGWNGMERDTTKLLAHRGLPTVALNSLRYFWRHRSPEETARAVDRMVRAYSQRWTRPNFTLVGFSFGANLAPLVVERLSPDVRERLRSVALLSPTQHASYHVGFHSWLGDGGHEPIETALHALKGIKAVCLRGANDRMARCPAETGDLKAIVMPGGHLLNHDAAMIAGLIANDSTARSLQIIEPSASEP